MDSVRERLFVLTPLWKCANLPRTSDINNYNNDHDYRQQQRASLHSDNELLFPKLVGADSPKVRTSLEVLFLSRALSAKRSHRGQRRNGRSNWASMTLESCRVSGMKCIQAKDLQLASLNSATSEEDGKGGRERENIVANCG